MSKKVTIVGGHGNIALRLARILSSEGRTVTSIIRNSEQEQDIKNVSATPRVLSLENDPVYTFTEAFTGQDVVYFSAGAGGKGGAERTKKVDFDGAVKTFEAITAVEGPKPRLILVSCIDVRDTTKVPPHYNEEDITASERLWKAIPAYMHWKYEADKILVTHKAFKWTILRPGALINDPGKGTADIGRTHISKPISRDDVAKALALLLDREDAAGLAIDLVGGDTPLEEGLDALLRVVIFSSACVLTELSWSRITHRLCSVPTSHGAPIIGWFRMSKKVIIVGGHGNVSLRLAKLLGSKHSVTSIIRDPAQEKDIKEISATPLVLSLEDDPASKFSEAFKGQDVVYFSAGAGGKGGEERTKKVDYEGAVKTFDAIEGVAGPKPRLILVSAIDVRDPEKIPSHYNEEDKAVAERVRKAIPAYMHWKYEADKNLVKRSTFKWTILRPGGLNNEPGKGTADIGRTHITKTISRDDVAKALAVLLDREDAAGLAIDFVGGDTPIEEGLDAFIKKGETDWLG
ncbi:hypothetical protein CVT26_012450 [Gymnopilus dilepis]|uniref:NAD(P)-binding domain-containing protein n=1 Tax=Gymnopilus dilepis TaxID=231916 RepID=A0A409YCT9_9AGAR|nr:hypothetical protein CVT26_012450 [Gymnopilus dilepis]